MRKIPKYRSNPIFDILIRFLTKAVVSLLVFSRLWRHERHEGPLFVPILVTFVLLWTLTTKIKPTSLSKSIMLSPKNNISRKITPYDVIIEKNKEGIENLVASVKNIFLLFINKRFLQKSYQNLLNADVCVFSTSSP